MDRLILIKTAQDFIQKYKYILLILLLGVFLLLLPERKTESPIQQELPAETQSIAVDFSQSLAEILSNIEGAGRVNVLLYPSTGEETVYQTNTIEQTNTSGTSVQVETVIISQGSGVQQGLICQINPGSYRGVLIVCQGGNDPVVKLQILEAVSKLTGLGSHNISVLKMK